MKSLSVTIQMKATEQFFPVVLFIMLYKVVQTFKSADGLLSVVIQVKLSGLSYSSNVCFPKFLNCDIWDW